MWVFGYISFLLLIRKNSVKGLCVLVLASLLVLVPFSSYSEEVYEIRASELQAIEVELSRLEDSLQKRERLSIANELALSERKSDLEQKKIELMKSEERLQAMGIALSVSEESYQALEREAGRMRRMNSILKWTSGIGLGFGFAGLGIGVLVFGIARQ